MCRADWHLSVWGWREKYTVDVVGCFQKRCSIWCAIYLLLSSAGVCTNNKALEIAPSVGRRPSQGVYRTLWPFSTFPCVPTHNTIGGRRRWSHGRWILLDIYIRMSSLQYSALSAFGETIRVPMACFFKSESMCERFAKTIKHVLITKRHTTLRMYKYRSTDKCDTSFRQNAIILENTPTDHTE